MSKSLSILIKPVSGRCGLKCDYCFYRELYDRSQGEMSLSTLEAIVQKAFAFADDSITFGFQGGEPTLRGLDFYRAFVELAKRYNTANIPTQFALQTNGMHIDGEWIEFLCENRFLVGLSLDGMQRTHDAHRKDAQGRGTFSNVLRTAKLLLDGSVDLNILCVVTDELAEQAAEVYDFFKAQGFRHLQFIPCLSSFDGTESFLSAERYGAFLVETFDRWLKDLNEGSYVSIRFFENVVAMLNGRMPEACDQRGGCSVGTVFEADGSMYPCDFYVKDEWRLGSILEESFDELLTKPRAAAFIRESLMLSEKCKACPVLSLCRGGCRRQREPGKQNRFCESYQQFYQHVIEVLGGNA